ncbi:major pollen allergen Ole e 10-like [Apium graveolens]|uniref:major pollen allergen Ole e 10-like n=1 Tax=Apium graveolens TaxID=4045 RepID=UPI003D7A6233
MANSSVYVLGFLMCIFVCSTSEAQETWCIAQGQAPDDKLQGFLDSTCGQNDCSAIQPGGSCYDPNTLQNHASFALDLVFRKTGDCNADIGTPSVSDPSFGNCHYP